MVTTLQPTAALTAEDLRALRAAYTRLERPSLAARLSSALGAPIETTLRRLPPVWHERLQSGSERSIGNALDVAIASLPAGAGRRQGEHVADRRYRLASMASGAVGGFFGLPALLIELPLSTTLMLRAIAEIARDEGESLAALETRLACVQVFALGGRSAEDDAAETGYYGVRLTLGVTLADAISQLGERGISARGAPALARLTSAIAARFGVTVSEKAAAQLLPVLGAAGGAAINAVFMQHFCEMARGHFTVRRLERRYGEAVVAAAYRALADASSQPP